jgi:hypothetical protein
MHHAVLDSVVLVASEQEIKFTTSENGGSGIVVDNGLRLLKNTGKNN